MLAAALAFLFTGCQQEEHFLDEVKVSSSYVAIPVAGGSVDITVTAEDKWEFTGVPEWVTVSPASGVAGETKVTFSAEATDATRDALIQLVCAGAKQNINVLQMAEKLDIPVSPIGDVLKAEAGTFRIKGEVYGIYNTQYGNFYMKDETGSILIYGCLDADGAEKNFSSLGIDNGDVIVCEGPLKIYNGTWELVNVSVISIEKSLLKLEEVVYGEVAEGEEAPTQIALEGGSAQVVLTSKTGGVNVEIADDAKSWLSVGGMNVSGTTVTVTLNAAANDGGDRTASVTFTAEKDGKTYTAETEVAQKGSVITFDEFIALEKGTACTLEGIVTGVHKKGYVISDNKGVSIYAYENGSDVPKVKIGDKVEVAGKKDSYNKCYQLASPTYKVLSSGNQFEYPTPINCTDALWAEMSTSTTDFTAKWVVVSGVPSGDYGDIAFGDGCSVSPYQTSAEFNYPANFSGKTVTLKGYVLQVYTKNDAKTLRVLPVSITEGAEEIPSVITVTDAALPTAYVKNGDNYVESTVQYDGIDFAVFTIANYGNGIQFRKQGGYIKNTTPIENIKSIKLTYHPDKSFYPTNLEMKAGETVLTPTTDDTAKTAVYDFSTGANSTFTLTNTSDYAVYLSKIEIFY